MAAPTIELATSGQGFSYARLIGPTSTHTDGRYPSGTGIVEDRNRYGYEAATEPGWRLKQLKFTRRWRSDYWDGTSSSGQEEMTYPLSGYEISRNLPGGFFDTIERFDYGLDNDGNVVLNEKYTHWYEDVVIETERDDLVEISVTRSPETEAAAQIAGGRVAEAGTTTYHAYPRETLTISLQATPLAGYRFTQWSSRGGRYIADATSAITTASIPVEPGWQSVSFTFVASFEHLKCTVTTAASPHGCGTTSGDGTYNMYSTCTVIATPAQGCRFLRWTTYNGTTVSRQRQYSFRLESDTYLVAHFYRWTNLILRSASNGRILRGAGGTILHDA